ncbi:MAG TPA: BrnA antitoxin family protein [Bryobacteraceae bacterium]|jgi:uncharacterized protein (DUF4415 family)
MSANSGNMKRYQLDPENLRHLTSLEKKRLNAIPIDYSDIPPLDEAFFAKATAAWPPAKSQLTIRLDTDVLAWLKANGKGYQTRINHILRAAMENSIARRPARSKSG